MSLRVAFAAVIRSAFKGDGEGVARRGYARLGELAGAALIGDAHHVRDAAEAQALASLLASEDLDLLVIQHATFATGDLLAPLLGVAERVVVWAVPERAGARLEGPDGVRGPLPLNSFCGLNMTLSFAEQARFGARSRLGWCYGDAHDPRVASRLRAQLAAARAARAWRDTRVLAIGGTAPAFYGLELPAPPFGAVVITHPLDMLFQALAAIDETQAVSHASAWAAAETSAVSADALQRAARIDLALQALAHTHHANAIAVRCWPEIPDRCDSMACAAMGRSGDRGVPAACEGDVWGALAMRVLEALAGEPAALLDLSDLDNARDAILLWHCGNAPLSFAAAGTRLTTHFNRDGVGVVRDQTLTPGPVTGLRILPAEGANPPALVVIEGTVLAERTPSFEGVRGWWSELRWAGEPLRAERALASILDQRLPHHLALVPGWHAAALAELAEQWGMTVRAASPRLGFA